MQNNDRNNQDDHHAMSNLMLSCAICASFEAFWFGLLAGIFLTWPWRRSQIEAINAEQS